MKPAQHVEGMCVTNIHVRIQMAQLTDARVRDQKNVAANRIIIVKTVIVNVCRVQVSEKFQFKYTT